MSRPVRPPRSLPPDPSPVEDPAEVLRRARSRIRTLGVMLQVAILLAWWVGLFRMLAPDESTQKVARNHRFEQELQTGPRGDILAADGTLLATSVRNPRVGFDPRTFRARVWQEQYQRRKKELKREPTVEEVEVAWRARVSERLTELAELMDKPVGELEQLVMLHTNYRLLEREVHPSLAQKLRRRGFTDIGVAIDEAHKRYYPQGTLAGQVIGLVNAKGHGVQGLEHYHDDRLRGKAFQVRRSKSLWAESHQATPDLGTLRGETLVLTLNPAIQRATERAVVAAMERHAARRASAVVLEVATGRILAMANAPQMDPNRFDGDFEKSRNAAISEPTEPGSVLKPFTYALALDLGEVRPDEVLDTRSPWRVYDRTVRDYHPRSSVTAVEMVKYSSNIAAGRLAQRIGIERMERGLRSLGFGEPTGIEISGESAGSRHPDQGMGPMELITVSYGHGLLVTPLQLASAVATLANEGVRIRPRLIDEVRDANGVVRRTKRSRIGRFVSEASAREALRAMEKVVEEGGTGGRAKVEGYRVVGKTGTAEKYTREGGYSRTQQVATFIGLAPMPNPAIAVAIAVDEPTQGSRTGGGVAAPVFSDIAREALPLLGIPPDLAPDEEGEGPRDLSAREPVRLRWVDEGWAMPDLTGRPIREVLVGLQGLGARVEMEGIGVVAQQRPAPGERLPEGGRVHLVFR